MNTVLLIEDEIYLLKELADTFPWDRHGFQLVGAVASIEEALEVYEKRRPDLIVTDIRLPGGSGLDIVRTCSPRAAIIITGHDQFDYARSALRLGVDDFLLKPIDDSELEEALRRVKLRLAGKKSDNPARLQPDTEESRDSRERHVIAAEDFIRRRYREDISLAEAAQELELSESYLSRTIKEFRNQTFVEMMTSYRLKLSLALLRDQRLRVGEIARSCGFQDQSYFARTFRRYYGVSPSRYRSSLKMNPLLDKEP